MADDKQRLLQQLKEDYETEWWRAKEQDDFNLKTKLTRVGCRPLKRKLLACQKSTDAYDIDNFLKCKVGLNMRTIYRN